MTKNIPSQVCRDPLDEKYTLHNQDVVQETLVSGKVQSVKSTKEG